MKKVKLSDVCNFSEDRTSVASLNETRYISTENLLPNRGGITDAVTLPKTSSTPAFVAGNILISNIRPYFKKIWYATFDGGCSADVLVFKADENIDAKFLYYVLSEDKFFDYMTATAKGTKMPRGDKQSIMNYSVPNFSLAKQKKIAALLGTLDDKIALNKKINATLEAMAKTLYDYWFVQFDFPDEHGKPYKASGGKMVYSPELGRDIPASWEVKMLNDSVTIATENINPMDAPDKIYEHYSIPAYDDGKFPSMNKGSEINSGKYVVRPKNILYSKLNPTFKRIWQPFCLTDNAVCSTEFLVFKLRHEQNFAFVYATLNGCSFQEYMIRQASASTGSRKRVQPDNCLHYPIIFPDDVTISGFDKMYSPIIEKTNLMILESRQLATLRDWLLPMLMDGQIEFKEA